VAELDHDPVQGLALGQLGEPDEVLRGGGEPRRELVVDGPKLARGAQGGQRRLGGVQLGPGGRPSARSCPVMLRVALTLKTTSSGVIAAHGSVVCGTGIP